MSKFCKAGISNTWKLDIFYWTLDIPTRYFHTIRPLRPVQIWYRAFYFFRKKWRRLTGFRYTLEKEPAAVNLLDFEEFIPSNTQWWPAENRFCFLHVEQVFPEKTDWNCTAHGKLWQYNLHYFDYLHQPNLDPSDAFRLMHDFVENLPHTPAALEPYPTALRIINWVKFLSAHSSPLAAHSSLDASLLAQAHILADNLEYHLLGNHLLEDAFALLFAACRYRDERLSRLAEKILHHELAEQILPDGGHYERSPMYHNTLLHRALDAYNLLKNNTLKNSATFQKLSDILPPMLAWAENMTHPNDQAARFNDSADGIAPHTADLMTYAQRLGIQPANLPLGASGYRKFQGKSYTLIADAGDIGPDYQPGHAHCDTLSFEIHIGSKPFLVNTGISTYEKNERRHCERSTAAHNTVQINDFEQSEIWDGHRVARRAQAVVLASGAGVLEATHTGYDRLRLRHVRRFECGEHEVLIVDVLAPVRRNVIPAKSLPTRNNIPGYRGRAHFHFHPDVQVLRENDRLVCGDASLIFNGFSQITLLPYEYAAGFNRLVLATKAVVEFAEKLETRLITHNS